MNRLKLIRIMLSCMICATALLSGCIKAEPTLILKKDGSGSFDLEYTITENAVTQFKAMNKLRASLAEASSEDDTPTDPLMAAFYNPSENALKAYFSKYKQDGVTIDKISVKTRGIAREVHVRLDFEKLSTFAKTDLFSDYRLSLSKNRSDDYVLRREAAGKTSSRGGMTDEQNEALAPMLKGFRVIARVNTPGIILRSNATKTSRYTTQWDFDYDRNSDALSSLHGKLLEVSFSGKAIEL